MLEAYETIEPGLGSYAAVRVWEVDLMKELCITNEETYISIPIKTRARMIAAKVGPLMNSNLEQDRLYKKMKKEQRQESPSGE